MNLNRSHLQQVVTIHQAMFQKLLFEEGAPVGLDLVRTVSGRREDLSTDFGANQRELCVGALPSRLNIWRKPASYSLGGLFRRNSSLNHGLLGPENVA